MNLSELISSLSLKVHSQTASLFTGAKQSQAEGHELSQMTPNDLIRDSAVQVYLPLQVQ